MNSVYRIQIDIDITPSNFRELVNFIETSVFRVEDDDCLKISLYQHIKEFQMLLYIEEWKKSENIKKRLRSPEFSALNGALSVLAKKFETKLTQICEVDDI